MNNSLSPKSANPFSEMPSLPTFDELPNFKNYTGCAWDVWPNDLGTINLLTDDVVKHAAQEEIRWVYMCRVIFVVVVLIAPTTCI